MIGFYAAGAMGTGEQFVPYIIWHFSDGHEGWSGSIVDGWLLPSAGASTEVCTSPDSLNLNSSVYRHVKLRIKRVGSPGTWRGWLRWITASDSTWDTVKQVQIPEPKFDENGIATIDVRDVPWAAENVQRIRFYLANSPAVPTNGHLIDWIAIGRTAPGASTA